MNQHINLQGTQKRFKQYLIQWSGSLSLLFLILTSCSEININKEKIDIGYHLLGGDTILLGDKISKLESIFGGLEWNSPEDLSIVDDTLILRGKLIPVQLNLIRNHVRDVLDGFWFDLPIEDTLMINDFTNSKKWTKRGIWNIAKDSISTFEYRIHKNEKNELILMYSGHCY